MSLYISSVSDEVEETPWARVGGSPTPAGMSLVGDDEPPWHRNDVGLELSSAGRIPRSRGQHSHPQATDNTHPNARSPFHFLVPAGPSPPFADRYHHHDHPHDDHGRTRPTSRGEASLSATTANHTSEAAAAASASPLPHTLVTRASTRRACFEFLVTARRTMELASDAADVVRSAVATAGKVGRAATGRTAQRTALATAAFTMVSGFLFAVACVGYVAFYNKYLPDQVTTLPVHLQYGYEVNPYGVVSLADQNFGAYQDYDISVTLNLPRSPTNLDRGNFMLALHLLDEKPPAGPGKIMPPAATPGAAPGPASLLDGRNILHVSTRPAIVPYTDPLVSLASRLLFLAYHVFVPASETTKLVVPMVEQLEFQPGRLNPTQLVLDVQAGQTLQVYSVFITITAQLRGLRWFMHTWWMTSFFVFTVLFWLCEMFFLGVGFLSFKILLGGSGPSVKKYEVKTEGSQQPPAIKQEGEGRRQNLEDVPMTFPTSSGQLPLRYDPPDPGHTNGVEGDEPQADLPPAPGGEADDEDEDAGAQEYDVLGELDEARDSGLGTSFSERDSASLRRRTSRGRMSGASS